MSRALIGYTGFVGGNLARQLHFDEVYNSSNIEEIRGRCFEEVYCAGISAVKWLANKEPENDLEGIVPLLNALKSVKARRFVLLSTIDVYMKPVGVDEDTPVVTQGLHPYGTHRRMVEMFVEEHFAVHHIVRLPGLFGEGLKKNVIYDLLNGHQIENIHPEAVFQFYGLDTLERDIRIAIDNDLRLVNFATEPVAVKDVAAHAFEIEVANRLPDSPARYDMRTKYGALFGMGQPYLQTRGKVLDEIRTYVARQKARGGA